jgi:hypothetical protein
VDVNYQKRGIIALAAYLYDEVEKLVVKASATFTA